MEGPRPSLQRLSSTSSEEYTNVLGESEDTFKERHTIKCKSEFRRKFSVQINGDSETILDSKTPHKERELIIKLLLDATFGQGKERLVSLIKHGFYLLPKGKKKLSMSSYLVSERKSLWLNVSFTKADGLSMELQKGSVDDRSQKRNGRYCHYKVKPETIDSKISLFFFAKCIVGFYVLLYLSLIVLNRT